MIKKAIIGRTLAAMVVSISVTGFCGDVEAAQDGLSYAAAQELLQAHRALTNSFSQMIADRQVHHAGAAPAAAAPAPPAPAYQQPAAGVRQPPPAAAPGEPAQGPGMWGQFGGAVPPPQVGARYGAPQPSAPAPAERPESFAPAPARSLGDNGGWEVSALGARSADLDSVLADNRRLQAELAAMRAQVESLTAEVAERDAQIAELRERSGDDFVMEASAAAVPPPVSSSVAAEEENDDEPRSSALGEVPAEVLLAGGLCGVASGSGDEQK